MTQEEKQLLLKDLCARSLYRPFVQLNPGAYNKPEICRLTGIDWPDEVYLNIDSDYFNIANIKPYLRPMSSMTKEEKSKYESFFSIGEYSCGGSLYGEEYEYIADGPDDISQSICLFDWLNEHHFDYRGLIEKGLALEAPENMYKTE